MSNESIVNQAYQFILERFSEQRKLEHASDVGGKLRTFSGDTVEQLVRMIWNELASKHGCDAKVVKGDDAPIKVTDEDGNYIEESVDQHCYIGDNLVLTVEAKTYLDKCYMQRADSDFALMREGNNVPFSTVIVSIENSVKDSSYRFFMKRGNIDKVFFLADGKRNSKKEKRIYNVPSRVKKQYIQDVVDYMESFFQ